MLSNLLLENKCFNVKITLCKFSKTNLNINIHRYDTTKQEHGRYKL